MPLLFGCLLALAVFVALPDPTSAYPAHSQDLVPRSTGEVDTYPKRQDTTQLGKRRPTLPAIFLITLGVGFLGTQSLLAGYSMSTACANAKGEAPGGWEKACIAAFVEVQIERVLYTFFGVLFVLVGIYGTGRASRTEGLHGTEGTEYDGMDPDLERMSRMQAMRAQLWAYRQEDDPELGLPRRKGKDRRHSNDGHPSLLGEKSCEDDADLNCVPHRVWYDSPSTGSLHRRNGAGDIHAIHHTPLDFDFRTPSRRRRDIHINPVQDHFNDNYIECAGEEVPSKKNDGFFSGTVYRMNLESLKHVQLKNDSLKLGHEKQALGDAARATLPRMQPALKQGQEGMFCLDFFVQDTDDKWHWGITSYYYQTTNPNHHYGRNETFLESCARAT
ncbi:hypothetical protein NUU61_009452 [Penicillium alfredii]|uniref:Uncharacterized protein n=1 Tax=Penicillium alfredii TaxID=1506179 RepID=A0A9W9EN41_9EURO|nr:uncharacterized protein NUU61_009452 [Penicillium alfredii]KAJ5084873.1 hypothetical protein NUU61_009452 [Penicillium alfredii]